MPAAALPNRNSSVGGPVELLPVMLLLGDEELLSSRALEQISAAARLLDPATEVTECAGGSLESADLYERLSPSLFGGRRVLQILAAQDLRTAAVESLAQLVPGAGDDVTVILQHAGGAKGKAVLDLARKLGASTISCVKLTRPEEKLTFIRAEVGRAGGTITPEAVGTLLDAVGSDLRELAAVAAQLVSDSGGRIDADLVSAYHRGRAEVSGFSVADLAVAGESAPALEALRWALSVGVPQVVIADALADGMRSLAKVHGAGRGNPNELAPRLGMPPWKVRKAQSQVRHWSEAGLRRALVVVADLNADVKGVAANSDYALERAIGQLIKARQSR
jgi:DNA polymerase-3 subunit delta